MRSSLPAACAAAFAFVALGSHPAFSGINTIKQWTGGYITPFGCPDTTTYGQVITIPNGKTHLNKFIFEWTNLNAGSMVLRGEVYAWDGTKATGSALYESAPRTISFSDFANHKVHFSPALTVTPGAQYVIFASIDKDYEQCQGSYQLGWGWISSDVYSGGAFVYQNNTGDESQWTVTPWTSTGDLAFKAAVSP